ncbi:unnamed protein product [Didymodactylos carnosus]|uniref:Uncharacterized protein n=1 Tax=Didymodactylos carnosus TaxID=1234261 RepID=A0A8S2CP54_9BILA|nr:unnamed protein product [Didymodactylos carnosus]CAF3545313.1 unnamed protein product [Didymodactylos carnosus]
MIISQIRIIRMFTFVTSLLNLGESTEIYSEPPSPSPSVSIWPSQTPLDPYSPHQIFMSQFSYSSNPPYSHATTSYQHPVPVTTVRNDIFPSSPSATYYPMQPIGEIQQRCYKCEHLYNSNLTYYHCSKCTRIVCYSCSYHVPTISVGSRIRDYYFMNDVLLEVDKI